MRPYVICHMVASLDGKVTGRFLSLPVSKAAIEKYYALNREYKADAYACGRVTMESSFTHGYFPELGAYSSAVVPREDYVADPSADFFAVSFDRLGRLGWQNGYIEDEDPGYGGAHIIEVLTEAASDAYLAYLRRIGVSYIFGGKNDTDILLCLEKLYRLFGIKRLLLEGGSILNGAFLAADVIDEVSLVVAPTVAEAGDYPLFWGGELSAFDSADTKVTDGVKCEFYKRRQKI